MKGVEVYEKKYIDKIDNIILQHKDKKYLAGFYSFIYNSMSYSSVYSYLNYIINFMEHTNKTPEELTLDDYTIYMATMRQKTSSYQIAVYSALKKFSMYLYASEQNLKNPMQHSKRPKVTESVQTKEKRKNGVLNDKEIKIYLETVDSGSGSLRAVARQENWKERDLLIVYLFLSTGMRCSALYKLDVNDINLNKLTICITDKRDDASERKFGKELLPYIKNWLEKREKILGRNSTENALFISNQKTRMDQSSISRVTKKYACYLSGKNITPHKLRATYGSSIYKETGDLYLTQKCMRHSNPKTTEIYIRGQEDSVNEKGIDAISKIFYHTTRQN